MTKSDAALLATFAKGYRVDPRGNVIAPGGRKRKLRPNTSGYLTFNVKHEGTSIPILVNRLAGYQEYGEVVFNKDLHVRHINGKFQDNRPCNLKPGTPTQNYMDRSRASRVAHARRAASTQRKLTDHQVATARRRWRSGVSLASLAAHYGVAKSTMSYAVNGRTYSTEAL